MWCEPDIMSFSFSDIGCYGNKNANDNIMYFLMSFINLDDSIKFIFRIILYRCLFELSSNTFWQVVAFNCWVQECYFKLCDSSSIEIVNIS